ncbi:MAG: 4a-hydroxytetrahydrobiopterin dehydratase [Candidatus Dadabacteria bacterium]|nr:MAG: 4a-hydroxytetrahydrobiopterin dehydratase [Candidatus Dadabacteria bacterium]
MSRDEGKLISKTCQPCREGTAPLEPEQWKPLLKQLDRWEVVGGHHLRKAYRFPDFRTALGFVNAVGELAEREGHHPELHLGWGRVEIEIWTHKIDGLSEADFVLAAKIDQLRVA